MNRAPAEEHSIPWVMEVDTASASYTPEKLTSIITELRNVSDAQVLSSFLWLALPDQVFSQPLRTEPFNLCYSVFGRHALPLVLPLIRQSTIFKYVSLKPVLAESNRCDGMGHTRAVGGGGGERASLRLKPTLNHSLRFPQTILDCRHGSTRQMN